MRLSTPAVLLAGVLLFGAVPVRAQNPTMADDFSSIIGWLSQQTAQGLGFNSGSTFDPPNEMKPWRIQPDISLGLGVMPFDKSNFPKMTVQSLEEKDPKGDLPDDIKFPNLTFHTRIGLPWRMDVGVRIVNMTIPKNYQLSPNTVGNGQSNTMGVGVRRHFFGGAKPLLTIGGNYNRVFGYFNFKSRLENVEIVNTESVKINGSSENFGQLDWNVTSLGVNMIVSQAFGKWTPFLGAGYNRVTGIVDGRLEAVWDTPLIPNILGKASAQPEPHNTRIIFGFQRDGSFFRYFLNGEIKTSGFQAGRAFVLSTGLAAPFKIGANSTIVRYGRNKPKNYVSDSSYKRRDRRRWFLFKKDKRKREKDLRKESKKKKKRVKKKKRKRPTHLESRVKRYWNWGKKKKVRKSRHASQDDELIFLR